MDYEHTEARKAQKKAYKQTPSYKAYAKAARKTYALSDISKHMFQRARQRAKKYGLEFSIEQCDVVIPDLCPVLGISLVSAIGKQGPTNASPSLDRIDSSKGYVKKNVQVISWKANRVKCDATLEELEKITLHQRKLEAIKVQYDYQFGYYEPGL